MSNTDKQIADLRLRVTNELRIGTIPDEVWEFVVEDRFVMEALDAEHAYAELVTRVKRLLRFAREVRGFAPRRYWGIKTIDAADTPYVKLRAEASTEVLPYHELDAVFGTVAGGRICVDAEPWVPVESVDRVYKEWQQLILEKERNRPLKEKTLSLYGWVNKRRAERDEIWRETMSAWNASSKKEWQYSEVSNFHRDYHRARHNIESYRERIAELERQLGNDVRL